MRIGACAISQQKMSFVEPWLVKLYLMCFCMKILHGIDWFEKTMSLGKTVAHKALSQARQRLRDAV